MDNSMKNSRRNFIKLAGAATVAAGTSKTCTLRPGLRARGAERRERLAER